MMKFTISEIPSVYVGPCANFNSVLEDFDGMFLHFAAHKYQSESKEPKSETIFGSKSP
jgi:hypothetical protein